jgi:hypothetical protein
MLKFENIFKENIICIEATKVLGYFNLTLKDVKSIIIVSSTQNTHNQKS